MLPTKFRFILAMRFQRRFLEMNQSDTKIVCGGHVCKQIGTKWAIFITVWVPVRRNWRVFVKFVGTLPFPIIDCQKRKGSM
jgi:hypothetical protein